MGRFYKTANPQYLDFMHQLPQETMLKAVNTADSQIAKQEKDNEDLEALLKLDAIDKDKPDAQNILLGYEDQIDEIAKEIQKDPLQFRRKSSKISGLKRKITTDFTRGDAFNIQSQYDTRAANLEGMRAAQVKNPALYNYSDIDKLQGQLDTNYKGFREGPFSTDRLREFEDINDFDKFGKGYKAEIKERLGAFKGKDGFLYTSVNRTERVDESMIKDNIKEMLLGDQKLNDYYRQQIELGNITEEEFANKIENTASTIGEKYGYLSTKKGTTSIKNDSKDSALAAIREQYKLNNPIANTTPGVIADIPLLNKYQKTDPTTGELIDNNTISGIDQALTEIGSKQRETVFTATKLAGESDIIITPEMAKRLEVGDFSTLSSAIGVSGETIDPKIILEMQSNYEALQFDRDILAKKKELASRQPDSDVYLQEEKDKPAIISNKNTFQDGDALISKNAGTMYNKNIKQWRAELDNSRTWWTAPLQFDLNSLESLPKKLRESIQDGKSITDLIQEGTIKPKTIKTGERPLFKQVERVVNDDDFIPFNEKTVSDSIQIGMEDIMQPTTEFSNFKVNGKFAKPAEQLDGQGNIITQFEIQINGSPITVYLPESQLSNKSIKQFMNIDAMKIGHLYKEAKAEGVIDEEGFDIKGVTFKKVNGKDVAEVEGIGIMSIDRAILAIAEKTKRDRQKILQKK